MTEKNFDTQVMDDPANGLWLLKFYAPWCGHCKQLTPVLDAVAPFLAGKMSIGKVDCTVEKKLCKRFGVKGYPTLKYHRDGDFHDYPLGRDKDSIITFGERMSDRAVKIVSNRDEAERVLLRNMPVAFLVYDPAEEDGASASASAAVIDSSGAPEEEKVAEKLIQSTERTRAFGQAARKLQAQGSFGLLSPGTSAGEIAEFFDGTTPPSGGFIARIEGGVPTRVYGGPSNTDDITEFVRETNIAAVIELGGHNFRFASKRGKALAIGAYDPDDETRTEDFRKELKAYAVGGAHRDDYVLGTMDGKKWKKFLAQFSVAVEDSNLPELFVIDTPTRTYWQDSSVSGVSNILDAVKSGEIESREQPKRKTSGLDDFLQLFVDYMPWSLVIMLSVFILVFYLTLPYMGGVDPVMPPMPPPPPRTPQGEVTERNGPGGSTKKDQ